MENADQLLEDFLVHLTKIGLIDGNDIAEGGAEEIIETYWETFQ
jgi:hypothetical protein